MPTTADRHYSTKAPAGPWDYVVIGSGMGGMTTAAMLAKTGRRVLVLEQHYVPGGFTHAFRHKQWTWDVGVHAVGEVEERAKVGRLLHALTDGRLGWAPLGEVYEEFTFPGLRIDFPNTREKFAATLKDAFPDEADAVDRYLATVRDVGGRMGAYFLSRALPRSLAPLAEASIARDAYRLLAERTGPVLAGITRNERLQAVLTAQWGYYGVEPARSSFAIHALTAKHFLRGGYYPVGGSARIAETLLAPVAGAGGWTRIRADVQQILVEKGRAVGVRLGDGEEIRATRGVVSAAGAHVTVSKLLPEAERQQPWAQEIARLKASPAHVCLYLGFKGDIRKAGASGANKWFFETWSADVPEWEVNKEGAEAPCLYCSFPSLKDPNHDGGPEQLHTGEVVTFVPYAAFEKWKDDRWRHRGEEYEAFKQRLTETMLAQYFRHVPELKPYLAYAELSTPVSTEHFTRATGGGIYGLEPVPERFATRALRPRTGVPGLTLSGSDVATVGVVGAMAGGVLAAVAAEPLGTFRYLRGVFAR